MKLCRYDDDRLGLVRGETVHDVTAALAVLPPLCWPLPRQDPLIAALGPLRAAIEATARTAPTVPLAGRTLRSPVASPGKIVAVRHNRGGGAGPGFFLKAASSVAGPGDGIELPIAGRGYEVEFEVAAIVGRGGRRIPPAAAAGHVAGYCIALDLALAGDEDRGLRKSADGFCLLGPWLTTADEIADPGALSGGLQIGGRLVARRLPGGLACGAAELLSRASGYFTLHPGDVLLTGSPTAGVTLAGGALLEAAVDGLGRMQVEVRPPAD